MDDDDDAPFAPPPPDQNPMDPEPVISERTRAVIAQSEAYWHVPYDIEVEQSLLGACLVDNKVIDRIETILSPETFYDPLHARLFEAMHRMNAAGTVITPLTAHAALKADPGLVELGGHAYLATLVESAPAIPNVRDLARVLRDLFTRRRVIEIGTDMVNLGHEPPLDLSPTQIIEEAEKSLYVVSAVAIPGTGPQDFARTMQASVMRAERAQARGGRISGVSTGFVEIDNLLGGLQPSDLLILAGRPGMGKTALATNIGFNAAHSWLQDEEDDVPIEHRRGAPVLYFSLEMAAEQLGNRILSEQTRLEAWKIRNGRFTEGEWETFVLGTQSLANLPFYIDDTGGISVAQIATRARRLKREKKIGAIFIDHIQLMSPVRRLENRVQEVTEMSKQLKTLAKELDVPIVALSQLSRGVDNRDDKRPVLSDLRESGSIEQDADVVAFVYREEYYLASREPDAATPEFIEWQKKMDRAHRRAEVLVEKHRHGATKKIELFFDGKYTKFSDMVKENQ